MTDEGLDEEEDTWEKEDIEEELGLNDDKFIEEAECPTCGATVSLDATECPECGQQFEGDGEEDLWEEKEDAWKEEEEDLEPWDETIEETNKGKLYVGFLVLFGGVGITFMSWFHNVIEWNPLGLEGYSPGTYGPLSQTVGVIGTIVTIIGIAIIYMWYRDTGEITDEEESMEEGYGEEESIGEGYGEEELRYEDAEPIDAEVK